MYPDGDSHVSLFAKQVVVDSGRRVQLLSNGLSDQRNESNSVQVQIFAKHFCKLLRRNQLLCKQNSISIQSLQLAIHSRKSESIENSTEIQLELSRY